MLKNISFKRILLEAVLLMLIAMQVWLLLAVSGILDFRFMRITNLPRHIIVLVCASVPILIYLIRLALIIFGKKVQGFGLILLVLIWIPLTFIISIKDTADSYTTDFANYRIYDNVVSDEGLLPDMQKITSNLTSNTEKSYYYHHTYEIDPTYDIYASFYINEDFAKSERERVEQLFLEQDGKWNRKYSVVEKNGFECLALHGNDTALFEELDPSRHTGYEYFIFAYNKSTGEVRYIVACSRYLGEMRPYYLKLEW